MLHLSLLNRFGSQDAGTELLLGRRADGLSYGRQAEALKLNKPVLVVGTPGRLAELSREGALQVCGSRIEPAPSCDVAQTCHWMGRIPGACRRQI